MDETNLKKHVTIYIDEDLQSWLGAKAAKGYKKASLIRHILRKQMEFERRRESCQSPLGQVASVKVSG